jgi:phage shock protein A
MPTEPNRPFIGVLLGFACVFFLFVKREEKPPQDGADLLLQSAQQQMREAQAKNRERAVQAITQKNNLQAMVDQMQRMVSRLEEQAKAAGQEGNTEREQDLLAERGQSLLTLTQTQASLQAAIETTEAVKTAMRREEERIRAQTAQALAMKAQQRQALIELTIEKSRLGMTTSYASDLFERAQAKIQQTQARRDLMAQLRKTPEVLEEAAEAASREGDTALSRRLLSERDELKKAALSPKLWES